METAEDKAKRVTASDEVFLTSHEWRELVRALLNALTRADKMWWSGFFAGIGVTVLAVTILGAML